MACSFPDPSSCPFWTLRWHWLSTLLSSIQIWKIYSQTQNKMCVWCSVFFFFLLLVCICARVYCCGIREKSLKCSWKVKSLFSPLRLNLCLLSGSAGNVYRVCLDEGTWQTKENSTDIWRDSSECSEKNNLQKNVSMMFYTVV